MSLKSKEIYINKNYPTEKRKLKESDFPLWERLLQGPSAITQIFLMDRDEQEVSNDVSMIFCII